MSTPAGLADHRIQAHSFRLAGIHGTGSAPSNLINGDLSVLSAEAGTKEMAKKRCKQADDAPTTGQGACRTVEWNATLNKDKLCKVASAHGIKVIASKGNRLTRAKLIERLTDVGLNHGGQLPPSAAAKHVGVSAKSISSIKYGDLKELVRLYDLEDQLPRGALKTANLVGVLTTLAQRNGGSLPALPSSS